MTINHFIKKLRVFLFKKIKINALNPTSYKPLWGIEVSRLAFFSIGFVLFLIFFGISYLIFSYTPLSDLLPDRVRTVDKEFLKDQHLKIDSLIVEIEQQEKYISNVRAIILGEEIQTGDVQDTIKTLTASNSEIPLGLSETEELLASKILEDMREQSNLDKTKLQLTGVFFFSPVKGMVSQKITSHHKGVDIVTAPNESIKATLDGVVIFSDWTTNDGRTIILNHGNQFISVYKHASTLLKKQGDFVRAGDPIAIVGSTGENSTAPHLHFELIFEGKYVNPLNYISFK
jgi:murein DD-endopeptidase MepM/ murein hydrolase activator NlpD